jgi:hypothetical protein
MCRKRFRGLRFLPEWLSPDRAGNTPESVELEFCRPSRIGGDFVAVNGNNGRDLGGELHSAGLIPSRNRNVKGSGR